MTDVIVTKCTRCNRSLRNAQMVDGAPYGPVCIRKLGLVPAEEAHAAKSSAVTSDPDQLEFTDLIFIGN